MTPVMVQVATVCDHCDGRGVYDVHRTEAQPAHAPGCWGDCSKHGCPVPEPVEVVDTYGCPHCVDGRRFDDRIITALVESGEATSPDHAEMLLDIITTAAHTVAEGEGA